MDKLNKKEVERETHTVQGFDIIIYSMYIGAPI